MKSALLVIDVQKIYTDLETDYQIENAESILENINQIITKAEEKNTDIFYIRHIHSKDGKDAGRMFDFTGEEGEIEFVEDSEYVEFSSGLKISPSATHIIKTRYDSFANTNLLQILREKNITKVIIVGFMTNFCCESTARSAHSYDFYVDFIKDATGTPGTELLSPDETINATCATLESGFANILLTEDVAF